MQRSTIHYAWIIVGLTFLVLLTAAGVRSAPGVLMVPLEHHFGWNRSMVSAALSINLLFYGLMGPFASAFMRRYGMRPVILIAISLVALGTMLTTQMTSPWQMVLFWGVFVGLGSGATANAMGAMIANRWFVKHRGLVVGILTASGATGQLIFLPVFAMMVEAYGWRSVSITTTAILLVIIPLVAIFMRNYPTDVGLLPYGAEGSEEVPQPAKANPILEAWNGLRHGLRSRDFWLLGGSFFICGATTNGLIGTHLIPASMDHGMAEVTAASLLAVTGVFDIVGTMLSGWLSDRYNNRKLLFWYYGLRGLALMFLPYALGTSYLNLAVFVVFYGLDWVATVPPTVRLAGDVFGKDNVGVVFGWIGAAHQLGASAAAYGAGAMHSWQGSYQVTFIASGILCLVASVMVLRIKGVPSSHSNLSRSQASI
jgi:MFS family permease